MNHLYFKINLNKFGELKQIEEAEKKTFTNFTIFFVISTILLSVFVIYLNTNLNRKLENRRVFLQEIERQVQRYQSSGDYLSSKDIERIATTTTNRVFWSRKLLALSTDISDKIAVTHFNYKNNIFSLYGITKIDDYENEFDLIIDDFIRTLKSNPDITNDFPEIKFVRATRDRELDSDIMRFQVDCIGKDTTARGR